MSIIRSAIVNVVQGGCIDNKQQLQNCVRGAGLVMIRDRVVVSHFRCAASAQCRSDPDRSQRVRHDNFGNDVNELAPGWSWAPGKQGENKSTCLRLVCAPMRKHIQRPVQTVPTHPCRRGVSAQPGGRTNGAF